MKHNKIIQNVVITLWSAPRPLLLIVLAAIPLVLAVLASAPPAGAAALPAPSHQIGRHGPAVAPQTLARQSPQSSDRAVFASRILSMRVRHLPYSATRQAQHSALVLAAAWQIGRYRRVALHPQPLVVASNNLKPRFTPAPQPAAAAPAAPVSGDSVHDAIYQASQRWHVSYWYLVRLATCESTLNPGAYNPSGASGLFQFMPSTYWGYASRIGEAGSVWNAYSNANVAAYMISQGQAYQWTCARMI